MTALSSGLQFISGVALRFGTVPMLESYKPKARKLKRRARVGGRYTPLTERQKKELLDSIRRDDWHE